MSGSVLDIVGRALATWRVDDYFLEKVLDNIAYRTGTAATMYSPMISATDPELSIRITVTIGDVSNYRPFVTIRVLPREPWLPTRLIRVGTISPETAAALGWALVCEVPVLVLGETGAGKTTLLMALAQYIAPNARVVLVQDVKEIRLAGEQYRTVIDLMVRYAHASGVREITWEDCFRQALRLTPDYILAPEVRTREARWLLEAFMTGHGGGSTLHAESPEAAIERLKLALSDVGIDFRSITCPIILIKIAKMLEMKHGITVPVRKVVGAWLLNQGELIELGRDDKLDIETLENYVIRHVHKLTLQADKYRKLLGRLIDCTLKAIELEDQGEIVDELRWLELIAKAHYLE